MEYMAVWEAQHIDVVRSVGYIASWSSFLTILGVLFYRSS